MNDDQVAAILGELGWRVGTDEVGDKFCTLDLGKCQVQVIPSVGKRADHYRVSLMPSISTAEFSSAVSIILGDGNLEGYQPIIVSRQLPTKLPHVSRDDVVRLSEEAVSWALSQNVGDGLAAYRNLPTDSKGAMPLRHLAALAIAKDVARLENYQNAFEHGDRLGFVPYIDKTMIDRAVTLARK